MISAVIVLLTVILASGYTLLYLVRPSWRARIEQPKHYFHQQLQQYDNVSRNPSSDHEVKP